MVALQLLPAVLAAVVLAAHFLRAGHVLLMLASLGLVGLMFVRRRWAARVIQIALVLATFEWLHTLVLLVVFRRQAGQPFTRLAIILGCVAAVTAASALMFRTQALRQRYQLG